MHLPGILIVGLLWLLYGALALGVIRYSGTDQKGGDQ